MKTASAYGVLVLVAIVLHLAWERTHVVLYTGYGDLGAPLPVWLYATAGDALYTLFGAGIAVLAGISPTASRAWSVSEYAFLASIGACIAACVEYKAQYLGLWSYTPAMPIIPFTSLGLSPLLQMTLLLPLSLFLMRTLLGRRRQRILGDDRAAPL